MGRTLKRVPLDFSWPLNMKWTGFLNQHYAFCAACPACSGSGMSPDQKRISDEWYGNAPFDPGAYGATPLTVDHPSIVAFAERQCERRPDYYGRGEVAVLKERYRLFSLFRDHWCYNLVQVDVDALVAADRLWNFTRRPVTAQQHAELKESGGYWLSAPNGYTPTADEVNAWAMSGGAGHDSINHWACVEARCKREGVDTGCKSCSGEGEEWRSPEDKAAAEAWEPEEPPTGDGFQLWETTSEGSPISPVFETLDALADWCADNATTFGSKQASAHEWRRMLDEDHVVHREGNMVFL